MQGTQLALPGLEAAERTQPVYEFDVILGAMGDPMARNDFNRRYAAHIQEGWQAMGDPQLQVSQQEIHERGVLRMGFMAVLVQTFKRPVAPHA
jgi:hypothetical protein